MTVIKSAYELHDRVQLDTGSDSEVQQCFKDECDMNFILRKHQKTGLLDHVNTYKGDYADLSEPVDYQTALNVVISAESAFSSLPSNIRKQFENSPHKFLEFVNNPDNIDSLRDLGLAKPLEQAPADLPPVVDPVEPKLEA